MAKKEKLSERLELDKKRCKDLNFEAIISQKSLLVHLIQLLL